MTRTIGSMIGLMILAMPMAPCAWAAAAPDLLDHATLESFMDGVMDVGMEEHHVTGAVVAIVKDGELVFSKGYGYQDVKKRTPVDPRTTLFRIGSTTKLLTWTAVMQLVEQGKLDLDTDVNQYLQGVQIPDAFDKPVTLRAIMTHTAGFEEGFLGYLIQSDPDAQLPILEAMKQHMPARVRPPGEMSSYSNYATALAGLIVQQVSGVPYNEYVQTHIFEPLDMQFAAVQEPVPERLAPYVGTSYKQENGAPVEQKYEIVGGFRPAGSGAVSAVDMAHFMIAHLQDGRYEDRRILEPSTAQRMHATAFQLDPRLPGMALGFYHSAINGLDVVGHGGDTNWCHTDLLLVPTQQVGLFMSFYTEDNGVRSRVTEAFFDRYFPAPDADEAPSAPSKDAAQAAQRVAGAYQFTRRNFTKFEKAFNLFSQLSVAPLANGHLVLGGIGKEPWQFRPLGDGLYRRVGGRQVMTFRMDEAGQASHLFLDFLPFMPAERVPWYEAKGTWFTALGLAFLVFIGELVRAGFRRQEIRAMPLPQKRAEGLAIVTSIWAVLTVAAIGAVFAVVGLDSLIESVPTSLKIALVMPVLFVVLTAALLFFAVQAWRARSGSTAWRVFYSLITLSALILSMYFWQWNVLGWQFG